MLTFEIYCGARLVTTVAAKNAAEALAKSGVAGLPGYRAELAW